MKRMLATVISAAMLLTAVPTVSYAQYPDVPDGAWYEGYLTELAGRNAIKGYEDGAFRPDKEVTEAEFIKTLISLTLGELKTAASEGEHWSHEYIEAAKVSKLFEEGRAIRYDEPITRAFMAELLSNAAVNILEEDKIEDVSSASALSDWKDEEYIAQCYCKGIIGGYEDGEFKPENKMTRAEMCAVLIRLVDKSQRLENVTQTPEPTIEPTAEPAMVHVKYIDENNAEISETKALVIENAGEMEINPANLKAEGYRAVGYSVDGSDEAVIIGGEMPLKLEVTGERDHNVSFRYEKFPENHINSQLFNKRLTWYDTVSHMKRLDNGNIVKCRHELKAWADIESTGFGVKGPDGTANILSGQDIEFGESAITLTADYELGHGSSGICSPTQFSEEIDMPAYAIYPPTVTGSIPFIAEDESGKKQPNLVDFKCMDDSPMIFDGISVSKTYDYELSIPEENRLVEGNKLATPVTLAGSDTTQVVRGFFDTVTEHGIRHEIAINLKGGGYGNTEWDYGFKVPFWSLGSIADKK